MARNAPGFFRVENITTTTPPGSPTHGVAYVPAATATDEWAGQEGALAVAVTSDDDTSHTWYFIAPIEGDFVWDKGANTLYVYDGTSLVDLSSGGGGGGAPTNAEYVVATSNGTLTAERVLGGESGVITIDNGTGGATTIQLTPGGVANAKLANMAQATVKGRASGAGTGAPTDLTAAQLRAILNVEDGAAADQSASEVAFTPAGSIAASDVQAAVEEVSGDVDTHLLALSNPHGTKWTNLGETPASFSGDGGKLLRVNAGATAVEHVAASDLYSGTSFPGSPYDGQPFYRTDLQMAFRYFGTRSKWLSEHVETFCLARNASGVSSASWLRRQNGVDVNLAPFYARRDGTIVEYSGAITGTVSNSDFDIGTIANLGASSLSSVLLAINRTSTGPFGSQAADTDFSSGDLIAVQYDPTAGGDSGNQPALDITIRWRAS